MAKFGDVLKTVGRGAMKGVLGFDDRDVRNKFHRKQKGSGLSPGDVSLAEELGGPVSQVDEIAYAAPVDSDGDETTESQATKDAEATMPPGLQEMFGQSTQAPEGGQFSHGDSFHEPEPGKALLDRVHRGMQQPSASTCSSRNNPFTM